NMIPEACIVLDQNNFIVKINHKAEQMLLFPKGKIQSQTFFEIAPQYVNTGLLSSIHKSKTHGNEVYIELCDSTTKKWFGTTIRALDNYVLAFFNDITDPKHLHNNLLNSEELFTTIFKNSPTLIAIISLDNNQYITVNDSYAKFFGYSPNEIVGKTKNEVIFPDDSQSEKICLELSNYNDLCQQVITVKTKFNEHKILIVSYQKIHINGQPFQLSVSIDVTDRVKNDKRLNRLESIKLIGQFSESIAHEIRNPLQTVKGFLQLLQSKRISQPYQEYLSLMIDELNKSNQIITELLSLSTTKPTNLKLHNINEIIENILPFIESQARKDDKIVEFNLNSVPMVMIDEVEIKQMILNLFKNGLEAIEADEIVKIETSANREKGFVTLTISDQGKGIPPELHDKIGLPFFTTKDNRPGLGLSTSLSILARHNARTHFDSNENGTTFYINFSI
ncbi:MAG: PAS domain S-box protein, partial [Eubacteriales bacterium]